MNARPLNPAAVRLLRKARPRAEARRPFKITEAAVHTFTRQPSSDGATHRHVHTDIHGVRWVSTVGRDGDLRTERLHDEHDDVNAALDNACARLSVALKKALRISSTVSVDGLAAGFEAVFRKPVLDGDDAPLDARDSADDGTHERVQADAPVCDEGRLDAAGEGTRVGVPLGQRIKEARERERLGHVDSSSVVPGAGTPGDDATVEAAGDTASVDSSGGRVTENDHLIRALQVVAQDLADALARHLHDDDGGA